MQVTNQKASIVHIRGIGILCHLGTRARKTALLFFFLVFTIQSAVLKGKYFCLVQVWLRDWNLRIADLSKRNDARRSHPESLPQRWPLLRWALPMPPTRDPRRKPLHQAARNRTASRSLYTSHWHDTSRHREGLITVFSSKQRGRAGNPGKLGIQAEATGCWGGSGAMGGHARHGRERGLQGQVPSCSTAEHQPRPAASLSSGF